MIKFIIPVPFESDDVLFSDPGFWIYRSVHGDWPRWISRHRWSASVITPNGLIFAIQNYVGGYIWQNRVEMLGRPIIIKPSKLGCRLALHSALITSVVMRVYRRRYVYFIPYNADTELDRAGRKLPDCLWFT